MTRSGSIRWNKSHLDDLFSSNKNDSPLHLHLTITLYVPGLYPSERRSNSFVTAIVTLLRHFGISTLGDNLYQHVIFSVRQMMVTHARMGDFVHRVKNLYDCASAKSMHTIWGVHCEFIIQLWDFHAKFVASEHQVGASKPSRRWVYVYFPACTDRKGEIH